MLLTVAFGFWPSPNHVSVHINNAGAGSVLNAIGNSNTQIVSIYQSPTNSSPGSNSNVQFNNYGPALNAIG